MAKVLVSMDDELLSKVDDVARREQLSRSAYLSRLAERDVARFDPERSARIQAAVDRLRRLAERYGTGEGDSTQQIREDRDSH
jgi:metal-responsive CopG/Arc/MetJ family transcriptional regulator